MFDELKNMVSERLGIEKEKITLETDIRKDIKADSAQLLEVILDIEEKYNIELPADLDSIKTMDDIVKYIEANK